MALIGFDTREEPQAVGMQRGAQRASCQDAMAAARAHLAIQREPPGAHISPFSVNLFPAGLFDVVKKSEYSVVSYAFDRQITS